MSLSEVEVQTRWLAQCIRLQAASSRMWVDGLWHRAALAALMVKQSIGNTFFRIFACFTQLRKHVA